MIDAEQAFRDEAATWDTGTVRASIVAHEHNVARLQARLDFLRLLAELDSEQS